MQLTNDQCLGEILSRAWKYYDEKNYSKSLREFESLYDKGETGAAWNIATIYDLQGKYSDTLEWLHKIQSGRRMHEAKLNIALMYYYGKGVTIDKNKCYLLLKDLPRNCTPYREYYLSIALLDGEEMERDFDLAARYSKESYEHGLLEALAHLASIRKIQDRYISWFFLKTRFFYEGIFEIFRIYVLGKKGKYIKFKIIDSQKTMENNGV